MPGGSPGEVDPVSTHQGRHGEQHPHVCTATHLLEVRLLRRVLVPRASSLMPVRTQRQASLLRQGTLSGSLMILDQHP